MASHFVYTPSELRANLRAALGYAEAGATVVIDRYGEKFILKHVPGESPYVPEFKQEYTPPSSEGVIPMAIKEIEGMKIPPMQNPVKNNSEGKPSKPRNYCAEHLVSKDVCKLMKHKA